MILITTGKIQGINMDKYDGLLFDAEYHDYEAEDAFTRYVPKRMQKRCVDLNGAAGLVAKVRRAAFPCPCP